MTDPFADQAAAAAAQVARATEAHHAKHGPSPEPPAALALLADWWGEPITYGCPHLAAVPVQPCVGFLRQPGILYCPACARGIALVDKRHGATCCLCGGPHPSVPLLYPLGEVGHLAGHACPTCVEVDA